MNLTGKTAGLCLFVLIFISLICAESLPGEESPLSEDPLLVKETLSGMLKLFNEESLISSESPPSEDPLLSKETLPDEKPLINEEPLVSNVPVSSDEQLQSDETLLSDELLFSDDSLVFEAPPLIIEAVPFSGTRSFDELFPYFSRSQRRAAMSGDGLRSSFEKDTSPTLIPGLDSGIDLLSKVIKRKPSHIIEALVVVPYSERELDLLDIYNALSRIKNIQNQQVSVNGSSVNTFVETTRLESAKNRKPISDPSPANVLPYSETIYLRLVDKYIGDLYIRGEITVSLYGMTYDMTNFRDVSYFIFRIMKAEQFSAVIYLEPIKEGVLIFSLSGIYLPGFIASRVNLTPNINRRISILINWITDGLRQESLRQKSHFYQLPVNTND